MKKVLSLGNYFVSDFVKEQPTDRRKYSLDLYVDEKFKAVRLNDLAPPESMWGQYWYRSGINASMIKELGGIVKEVTDRVKLKEGDVWLDIACNDGTLLKAVPYYCEKIGIDPADNTYFSESSKVAKVAQTYFNKEAYYGLTSKKAKVVTCIAMFYDLADPIPFINDIADIMDNDGVLVLQMSYTPLMLKQMAFDNICHEHTYYYSLQSIVEIFDPVGFKVVDANINDTNGGSMRIYLQKKTASENSFGTSPLRDVCTYRVNSILGHEINHYDITKEEVWHQFSETLDTMKNSVSQFIRTKRAEGKTVWGYGASTKGNTLLQYFDLTNKDIDAIAERSEYKFGLRTIGTDIPIKSEAEMRDAKPDYLLILPWHFIGEFREREAEYIANGGSLIVPCPEFLVIDKDGEHDWNSLNENNIL